MKNKVLLVVSALFGLLFINSGLNKFFQYMPMPDSLPMEMLELFTCFFKSHWLLPLVAIGEIIGGLLIIIPKTRALGAIMLFPILLGIVCAHYFQSPDDLVLALVFMLIEIWIIYENRNKYMAMIS